MKFPDIQDQLEKDGWKKIRADTYYDFKREYSSWQHYLSPKTNRLYMYDELCELYLKEAMTEGDLYPAFCCEKTLMMNTLYPKEKPDIIKIKFHKVGDKFLYEYI